MSEIEDWITLTDVERWYSQYPDLWDIYVSIWRLLITHSDEPETVEFQVPMQLKMLMFEIGESNIKVKRMLDAKK